MGKCINALVLVLFFKDEDGNPMETEYGKSSLKDHQTFTIQVALLCPIDVVDVILVTKSILKRRFTVCSWMETPSLQKGKHG